MTTKSSAPAKTVVMSLIERLMFWSGRGGTQAEIRVDELLTVLEGSVVPKNELPEAIDALILVETRLRHHEGKIRKIIERLQETREELRR